MKKILFLFLLTLSAVSFGKWDDPNAKFRVTVEQKVLTELGYVDFKTLCLPEVPENGFRVFDDNGKPVSFHQIDGKRLYLPRPDKKRTCQIYFGYAKKQPRPRFDAKKIKIPYDFKLRQHSISKGFPDDIEKWNDPTIRKPHSRFARLLRERNRRYEKFRTSLLLSRNAHEIMGFLRTHPLNTYKDYISLQWEKIVKFQSELYQERLNECEKLLFFYFRDPKAGSNAARIFFTLRPFDTDRFFITCFSGNLIIPEDGTYEFLVNTNSTRLVRINGKCLVRLFGATQAADTAKTGSTDLIKVQLKRGTVPFQFIYSKGPVANWAAVSIKRPGDQTFHLLSDDDFAPSAPVTFSAMENQYGGKYPLVFRNDSLAIYTGKRENYSLDEFQIPENFDFHWEIDGERFSSVYRAFALKNLKKPVLKLIPEEKTGLESITIFRTARNGVKGPVEPDLTMKLWMPWFLYDDEYGSVTLEMSSRLPINFYASLSTTVSLENPWFKTQKDQPQYFSSMPMEHEDRFAPNVIRKKSIMINAKELEKTFTADFTIKLPGLVFDRCGILFAKVADLPELKVTRDGLCDLEGRRVFSILHRRSLHEVRSWELLKQVRNEITPVKKIFIVAEDFGSFSAVLKKNAKASGQLIEFIPWKKEMLPSGSPALNTVPEILKALRKTDADAFAVIPIHNGGRGTASDREELNILSLLIETAQQNPHIRIITLSTPMPSKEAPQPSFDSELRKLGREKGIDFAELGALFRTIPPKQKAKEQTGHKLPVLYSREMAELFYQEISSK